MTPPGGDAGGLRGVQIPATPSPSPDELNTQPLTLISPAAGGLQTDPANLTFTWTPHPRARWYRLRVENGAGKALLVRRFDDPTAICTESLCTVQIADTNGALKDGRRYRWLVAAKIQGREELRRTEKRPFKLTIIPPIVNDIPVIYETSFTHGVIQTYWMGWNYDYQRPTHVAIDDPDVRMAMIWGNQEDVDLRARVTVRGGQARLGVRHSGLDGFYSVELDARGDVALKRTHYRENRLEETILEIGTYADFAPGQPVELRLIVLGNTITAYVNNLPIVSISEIIPLRPGTTFIGTGAGEGTDVEFDHLILAGRQPAATSTSTSADFINVQRTQVEDLQIAVEQQVVFRLGTKLYTLNSSGDNSQILVNSAYYENHAVWSPNGQLVAFSSDRGTGFDIHLLDVTTGWLILFPFNDSGDSMPTFSPNGQYLLFSSTSNDPNAPVPCILRRVDISPLFDGDPNNDNNLPTLTVRSGNPMSHPAYSPDGSKIAFAETFSSLGIGQPEPVIETHLRVRTLSNGSETVFTGIGTADDPEWSPDGTTIAYHSLIDNEPYGIGLLNPVTGIGQLLTDNFDDASPSWVNNDVLIFARGTDLFRVNASPTCGTQQPILFYDGNVDVGFPDWKPGGLGGGGGLSAPNCIQVPTPVPPTLTPTPTLTTPEYLATVFPLPIDPISSTPHARLSDGQWVDRLHTPFPPLGTPTRAPLCSRDLNPPGLPISQPLISPWAANVLIADSMVTTSLGKFVALEIPIVILSGSIKTELLQDTRISQNARTLIGQDIGSLFVGYGHMSNVNFDPTPSARNYPSVGARHRLGDSGDTGIPTASEIHLDVSVFYVSGKFSSALLGTPTASAAEIGEFKPSVSPGANPPINNYFAVFRDIRGGPLRASRYGLVEIVDPTTIWPLVEADIQPNQIDSICP